MATLCIEKKLLDEIDIDPIISDFASRNVRRNFYGNIYKLFDTHTDFQGIGVLLIIFHIYIYIHFYYYDVFIKGLEF